MRFTICSEVELNRYTTINLFSYTSNESRILYTVIFCCTYCTLTYYTIFQYSNISIFHVTSRKTIKSPFPPRIGVEEVKNSLNIILHLTIIQHYYFLVIYELIPNKMLVMNSKQQYNWFLLT